MPKLSTRIDRIRKQLDEIERDLSKARNRHGINARWRVRDAILGLDRCSDDVHFYERAVARRRHR